MCCVRGINTDFQLCKFNDKTDERIAMSERMKTVVVLWWPYCCSWTPPPPPTMPPLLLSSSWHLWSSIAPECWPNVINLLSAPGHVPNWSTPIRPHQSNCVASACCSQLSIYSIAYRTFRQNSAMMNHHFRPTHTNNCRFQRLHGSTCEKENESID